MRLALFPVVIKAQRNMAHMNRHLPEMQAYQVKQLQARTLDESEDEYTKLSPQLYNRMAIIAFTCASLFQR